LIDLLHSQTSAALSVSDAGQSTLAGAVLGGIDLSLAAVVLGTSPSVSPATTPASVARRQPEMRIHVTTESPERVAVTSTSSGQTAGALLASGIGRRSAGVPHGSVRAFQQQQQQQHSGRQVGQHHNTLLVVPSSSSRTASSSSSMTVNARGGSVSTSPSSASPSPSPEPVSRHSATTSDCRPSSGQSSATSRSLSTRRPLDITRTAADDHSKPSRSYVQQRHCDQRKLTGAQATLTDELQEQETFV